LGFELFNDCLFYRRQAKDLYEGDKSGNIFGIRRSLRNSFVCLSLYLESRVNEAVYGAITKRLFELKHADQLGNEEIERFDRFSKLDFGLKLDLLELLSGANLKEDSKLNKGLKRFQTTRNAIIHTGQYGWNESYEDYMAKIDDGIATTRRFVALLHSKRLTSEDKFLSNEEPVDMTKLGFGYLTLRGAGSE
jgi:hypothetical protein